MSVHNISDFKSSKFVKCNDCGWEYLIAKMTISSMCGQCGNVIYHPLVNADLALRKNRVNTEERTDVTKERSECFDMGDLRAADDFSVEEVLLKNQKEWQLWANVVENFYDSNRHIAYLTYITRNEVFSQGMERYMRHRTQFLVSILNRRQVIIADLMLEKIGRLCFLFGESILPYTKLGKKNWIYISFCSWRLHYRVFFIALAAVVVSLFFQAIFLAIYC